MPNDYTVTPITSAPILISSTGILDNTTIFPSAQKLVIIPNSGVDILAREFKVGHGTIPMSLSYHGEVNSHTQWPSKFQWHMGQSSSLNPQPEIPGFPTPSGLAEWPVFYKIVFQDSNNLTNNPNWILNPNTSNNQVFVRIYFGKNETTLIDSSVDLSVSIDIDRQEIDPLTEADTLNPATSGSNIPTNINSFTIS